MKRKDHHHFCKCHLRSGKQSFLAVTRANKKNIDQWNYWYEFEFLLFIEYTHTNGVRCIPARTWIRVIAWWLTSIRIFYPLIVRSTRARFSFRVACWHKVLCLGCNNFMIRALPKKNESRRESCWKSTIESDPRVFDSKSLGETWFFFFFFFDVGQKCWIVTSKM